jgi:hypothetical protein
MRREMVGLVFVIAFFAIQDSANMALSAFGGLNPGSAAEGRVMSDMLAMSAL